MPRKACMSVFSTPLICAMTIACARSASAGSAIVHYAQYLHLEPIGLGEEALQHCERTGLVHAAAAEVVGDQRSDRDQAFLLDGVGRFVNHAFDALEW